MHGTIRYRLHARWLLLAWAVWVGGPGVARAASEPVRDVRFQWALRQRAADGSTVHLSSRQPLVLKAGDALKLMVKPETNLFLYILLLDSSDALYAIFPPAGQPASALPMGQETVIPAGEQWFELDQAKGVETFHVLAAPARLAELEALCSRLKPLGEAQDRAAQQAVLKEIRALSKRHGRLATQAEKPISIAGTLRSVGDAPPEVNQVSATGFASKIIEVEH